MQRPIYTNDSMNEILRHPDTRGHFYCRNIAIWYDGTMRPAMGHHGNCQWFYDGQVFYHLPHKERAMNNTNQAKERREMMKISFTLKNIKFGKIPYDKITLVKIWFIVAKKGTDWNWAIWSEYKRVEESTNE